MWMHLVTDLKTQEAKTGDHAGQQGRTCSRTHLQPDAPAAETLTPPSVVGSTSRAPTQTVGDWNVVHRLDLTEAGSPAQDSRVHILFKCTKDTYQKKSIFWAMKQENLKVLESYQEHSLTSVDLNQKSITESYLEHF